MRRLPLLHDGMPLTPVLRCPPPHVRIMGMDSTVHRWAKAWTVRRRGAEVVTLVARRCMATSVGLWRGAFAFQRASKAVVAGVGARVTARNSKAALLAWRAVVRR